MFRSIALAVVGLALFASTAQAQKAQMVKGTVKSADSSKDLLIINQIVKKEKVDRELSIKPDTEFVITDAAGKTTNYNAKDGLAMLAGQEGAEVQVKCDKDVNVLKVTAKLKK